MADCVYLYRVRVDSGLAPCVQDGLWTLACCKGGYVRKGRNRSTGIRYWVGDKRHANWEQDRVYVGGTYQEHLLYLARVTEVKTMEEYFSSLAMGRLDAIYDGSLKRNRHLANLGIHMTKEEQQRDRLGKYVLCSDDFIYWGKGSGLAPILENGPKRQETKRFTDPEQIFGLLTVCKEGWDHKSHEPHDPLSKRCGQRGCAAGCGG